MKGVVSVSPIQEVVSELWHESCEKPVTSDKALASFCWVGPAPGEGLGVVKSCLFWRTQEDTLTCFSRSGCGGVGAVLTPSALSSSSCDRDTEE